MHVIHTFFFIRRINFLLKHNIVSYSDFLSLRLFLKDKGATSIIKEIY